MMDGLREGYPIVHIASHFRFIPESADNSFSFLAMEPILAWQQCRTPRGYLREWSC